MREFVHNVDGKESTQNCGAMANIYHSVDNQTPEESQTLNEDYWIKKNSGGMRTWSGIRVYKDASANKPEWYADANEVTYLMSDWGLADPSVVSITYEMESGASSLISVAAATISAFLML